MFNPLESKKNQHSLSNKICVYNSNFLRVSYVTAIFLYIMITALIIRGVTLPGAYKGIEHYTLKLNTEALFKLQVNF